MRATAKDDAYESPLPIGTNVNLIVTTTDTRIVKTTMDGLGRTIKVETGDSNGTQSVVDTQYGSCACSPLGKVEAGLAALHAGRHGLLDRLQLRVRRETGME